MAVAVTALNTLKSTTSIASLGGNAPDAMSSDRLAMDAHVVDVSRFLEGAPAVVAGGEAYLPRFAREHDEDYRIRLGCAKFTNVFRDLVENLSSKPFARTVDLLEDSKKKWPALAEFVENVDGAGNHLHVFAGELFFNSIAYTIDWLVVDKTPVAPGASLAEERRAGARVYWYRVPHENVRAVFSDVVDGEEIITHFRFAERSTTRNGFGENIVERVRVFDRENLSTDPARPFYDRPKWFLYERTPKSDGTNTTEWREIDRGDFGLEIIPVIPIMTGRRIGKSWQFVKTMSDVVHLQKKLYQNETNLEYTKLMVGSPMLAGVSDGANGAVRPPVVQRRVSVNGIEQIVEEAAPIVVGPKTVLYGDWKYVNIDANSIQVLEKSCDRLERQMREIGRQPLTTDSGNLTVVTTMFAAQKGNSAVQAWALALKDRLELAFKLTAMWMNLDDAEPEVSVWTDFSIDLESEAAPSFLLSMYDKHVISREQLVAEAKRRNFLAAEYDANTDIEKVRADLEKYEFLATAVGGGVGAGTGTVASGGSSATARVRADLRQRES